MIKKGKKKRSSFTFHDLRQVMSNMTDKGFQIIMPI